MCFAYLFSCCFVCDTNQERNDSIVVEEGDGDGGEEGISDATVFII